MTSQTSEALRRQRWLNRGVYVPRHFAENDPNVLRNAIRSIGAGHLITVGDATPLATFMPFVLSDDATTLTGHIAKGNQQWKLTAAGSAAIVCWVGPHAYISPSHYATKTETGRVVPTWDYIAIQAQGTVTFHDDPTWLREQVTALTDSHEAARAQPWALDDAPADYVEAQLRGIIGVTFHVTSLQGAWKLSQNKSEADISGVLHGLTQEATASAIATAAAIKERTERTR